MKAAQRSRPLTIMIIEVRILPTRTTSPQGFSPTSQFFAKLTNGVYAIFDSCLILHENFLENPVKDGGGNSVLRSTLRASRPGLKVTKYSWAEQ